MKYFGKKRDTLVKAKTAILLTNLGTPEAPTAKALRTYLAEFLADPRVVEIPKLIWLIILHGIILRVRPKKSAQAYQEVWTNRGSPLKFYTEDQVKGLKDHFGNQYEIDYAMRYGTPSVAEKVHQLLDNDYDRVLVLPLYPQYASSTTGSTFDALAKDFVKRRTLPHLRFVAGYYNFEPYIEAVANSIKSHWQKHGRADKLMLSFHGLPKVSHRQGDPYYLQCLETSKLIAEKLEIGPDEYMTVFQSRFGAQEWLKPYTDATLKQLPKDGIKSVQIVCPGFASDCLETIEEIEGENREYFMEAGGERYEYIPALNASEAHISALAKLIELNTAGW